MDPITHGVIGLGISAFSGDPVSLMNPVSLGAALGAMSPDVDAVTRILFDDKVYLKHHRGRSHSVPFLAVFSVVITAGLSLVYPDFNFLRVLAFTFLGALSHTFFDILNSYGAMLFTKKRKLSVLMLYDPLITAVALFLIFHQNHNVYTYTGAAAAVSVYILLRLLMRLKVQKNLGQIFSNGYRIDRVCVMPALMAFHKWDFIINTRSHDLVGQYNLLRGSFLIRRKLRKNHEARELMLSTSLGRYFNEFSPNFHVMEIPKGQGCDLKVVDLRYFLRGEFMHNGLVELDQHRNVLASYFMPYRIERKIALNEQTG
ncbi:MAG: hypothetical protein AVO33_08495 [delta proteobacterium ML8_F1]|nr:MAG: hypothetical protein AVO33_08495 [delta proteobacterium ML8_F1]